MNDGKTTNYGENTTKTRQKTLKNTLQKNSKSLQKNTKILLFTTLNIIYKENVTQTPLKLTKTQLKHSSLHSPRQLSLSSCCAHFFPSSTGNDVTTVMYITGKLRFSAFRIRWNYVDSVNGRGVTVIWKINIKIKLKSIMSFPNQCLHRSRRMHLKVDFFPPTPTVDCWILIHWHQNTNCTAQKCFCHNSCNHQKDSPGGRFDADQFFLEKVRSSATWNIWTSPRGMCSTGGRWSLSPVEECW